MLREVCPDARVADLFAGSGVLGLEAWSRGARSATWVEADPAVSKVLRANIAELCEDEGSLRVLTRDVWRFLAHPGASFDLVFADPPYAATEDELVLPRLLELLETSGALARPGILVFEQARRQEAIARDGWEILRDRMYGKTRVLVYKLIG
jgi:16S rRNA (guanine966-N2)-methyltransferase